MTAGFDITIHFIPGTTRARVDVTGRGLTVSEWTEARDTERIYAFAKRLAEQLESDLRLARKDES